MAVPTCIKCGGHSFELGLLTPLGKNYKLKIVQCSNCGVSAGVIDPNVDIRIETLSIQITSIDERLSKIAKALIQ